MKDSDVIEALECCTGLGCDKCKFNDGDPNTLSCEWELKNAAMEVLKRQQAEVERLKTEKDNLIRNYKECAMEAVKDFAERLKARVKEATNEKPDGVRVCESEIVGVINEVVAEMERENDRT